jgi:hypothetical protein
MYSRRGQTGALLINMPDAYTGFPDRESWLGGQGLWNLSHRGLATIVGYMYMWTAELVG